MSNETLSDKAQEVSPKNEVAWFYEEPNGITLYYEIRDGGGAYMRTDHMLIPWGKIRQALKRKDA